MDNNYNDLLFGIDSKVQILDGRKIPSVNFDNAATTPPFRNVVDSIMSLSNYYASIGRGAGQKAEITTRAYHESKEFLLDFFNIKDKFKYTVIYVKNTTDGMNKLARTLIKRKDDIVISTRMEHHSNDLPWRKHCIVKYVEVDEKGRLKFDQFEKLLKNNNGRVKYVSVTGASNVTGYMNDIHAIAKVAHKYNAKIIVDGAQLVPHQKVKIQNGNEEESIDFLVFSGHKLYAPFGTGVIIGLKNSFNDRLPDDEGGGTVNFVMDRKIEYLTAPERNEAGTPNFFGAIAIERALQTLDIIGFDNIYKHEQMLKTKLLKGLKDIPDVINYGDMDNYCDRLGIGVFNIKSLYHGDVAEKLAKIYGISVRQGWFCAHPYCRRLMHINEKAASAFIHDSTKRMPGMIRASFGIYNTVEEIDYFLNSLEEIIKTVK